MEMLLALELWLYEEFDLVRGELIAISILTLAAFALDTWFKHLTGKRVIGWAFYIIALPFRFISFVMLCITNKCHEIDEEVKNKHGNL